MKKIILPLAVFILIMGGLFVKPTPAKASCADGGGHEILQYYQPIINSFNLILSGSTLSVNGTYTAGRDSYCSTSFAGVRYEYDSTDASLVINGTSITMNNSQLNATCDYVGGSCSFNSSKDVSSLASGTYTAVFNAINDENGGTASVTSQFSKNLSGDSVSISSAQLNGSTLTVSGGATGGIETNTFDDDCGPNKPVDSSQETINVNLVSATWSISGGGSGSFLSQLAVTQKGVAGYRIGCGGSSLLLVRQLYGYSLNLPSPTVPGTYTLTLTVNDDDSNSSTATYTYIIPPPNTPPLGYIDGAGDSVTGSTNIFQGGTANMGGWAYDPEDGANVASVQMYLGGAYIGNATLGGWRSDLGCNCGWNMSYSIPSNMTPGTYSVTGIVYDNQGANQWMGTPKTITVVAAPPPSPTGHLYASSLSCTIPAGGSSCTVPPITLTWDTSHAVGNTAVTSPADNSGSFVNGSGQTYTSQGGFTVSSSVASAGSIPNVYIPYNNGNGRDFYLFNSGSQLAPMVTVSASCVSGTTWNSVSKTCVTNPSAPTVSLSASPVTINAGASTTLTWSVTNATICTASSTNNDWNGSKSTSNGSDTTTPASTETYTLTCTGPGGSAQANASVTINTGGGSGTAGVCSTTQYYVCSVGVSGHQQNFTSEWDWTCTGTNGTDVQCPSIPKVAPKPVEN